jgi:hypothetical protein
VDGISASGLMTLTWFEVNQSDNNVSWNWGVLVWTEMLQYFRLQDELVEWRNQCSETKSFCTPPTTNAVDFESLYEELMYGTHILNFS